MCRTHLGFLLASLFAAPAGAQSVAYVEQVGSSNTVSVTQTATAVSPLIVRIQQVEGHNGASVFQEGAGHLVAGLDGSEFAFQSGGSQLDLSQFGGTGSRAYLRQTDASRATVVQDGSYNEAYVDQRDGGVLDLLQTGASNWASVFQAGGGGNEAYIEQGGGALADVVQQGVGNVARINQSTN